MPPDPSSTLDSVFSTLKPLLDRYRDDLDVRVDVPGHWSANLRHRDEKGQPLPFGSVRIMKRWVSFHLMPVAADPSLLGNVSVDLLERMHGNASFNFSRIETALLRELDTLVQIAVSRCRLYGLMQQPDPSQEVSR